MHRWLQYITPSEASYISSDILILFLILLEISFFTLHEKDILKISYPSLCDQISSRISDRVSGPFREQYIHALVHNYSSGATMLTYRKYVQQNYWLGNITKETFVREEISFFVRKDVLKS